VKRELLGWPCSVARAVAVFGDAWTLMILRDCMHGVTRFDEFQKSLQIARNTLSDRLSGLVDAGLLEKRFYQDNPPRYEYLLTDMGYDLFPVISAMLAWGDKWLDEGEGAPVRLHHETCNHDVQPEVVCGHCHEPIVAAEVQFCVGPGFPEKVECGTDFRDRLAAAPGAEGGRPHANRAAS
jgi:DNA-binding HxlR family transcriptional regulator